MFSLTNLMNLVLLLCVGVFEEFEESAMCDAVGDESLSK